MRILVFVTVSALFGCGQPLTDSRYPGEYLFRIRSDSVSVNEQRFTVPHRTGILWMTWDAESLVPAWSFQGAVGEEPPLVAPFELALYYPPSDEQLNERGPHRFGYGVILAFEDVDGDGTLTLRVDWPTAAVGKHAVLYVPSGDHGSADALRAWPAIRNPSEVRPGFMLARAICQDGPVSALEIVAEEPVAFQRFGDGPDCTRVVEWPTP
jgi:hypothetical protein